MEKRLLIAALCGVFMALPISPKAHAQGVNLTGTWQPAHGNPSEIENGKIVGETLTFSFTRNTHPINATGHLSGDTISFDITGHKWGMSKTVHRTATRIALN